ncbi:FixH family protein [Natrialbaceae archaeon A-CW2]|uniref:FixH family protein n=1 Tax=Natronosalvus amylolyticus TaxID=2961994 RepID=UPI0020CA18ED|nr:FixH family protein [Natronosalvus amylolyticus]
MNFETEACIGEYVIDGENTGIFAGDDTSITYTPDNPEISQSVTIPIDEITSVTFKRDTTLLGNRFLGWFFGGITIVLIVTVYMFYFAGTNPSGLEIEAVFLLFLIIGGIATTYNYLNGEECDVIVASVRTNDGESQVFAGRMKNTEFVGACCELIESDIETRNLNEKLGSELSD